MMGRLSYLATEVKRQYDETLVESFCKTQNNNFKQANRKPS
jgi:hypothetical protein